MRAKFVWASGGFILVLAMAWFFYARSTKPQAQLGGPGSTASPTFKDEKLQFGAFDLAYSSTAASRVSLNLAAPAGPNDKSEISIVMDLRAQMLLAKGEDLWVIQLAPISLDMKNQQGAAFVSRGLTEDLARTTFFWKPGNTPILESDGPITAAAMGVIQQILASLVPVNDVNAKWLAQDLQKQCSWSLQKKTTEEQILELKKDQCRSVVGDDLVVELLESKGEASWSDGNMVSLFYAESAQSSHASVFVSRQTSQLKLTRAEGSVKGFWHEARPQRVPVTLTSTFGALPRNGVSTEQDPISLSDVNELAKAVQDGKVEDRVAAERKFVHFARQHPEQVRELLPLVEGSDSKNPLFRMIVVALAEGRNAASQKALTELMDIRKKDAASTELLFGAAAQMKEPNEALINFTRATFESESPGSRRDISGLALGGMIQHVRDSQPALTQSVVSGLHKQLTAASDEKDKLLLISIVGNAGMDESLAVLLPFIQDPRSNYHTFAIQSLRFLRDEKSYAILLEQLLSTDEPSRRSALMAIPFRAVSEELVTILKNMVLNSREAMYLRVGALEDLGRKAGMSPLAKNQFRQIDRNQLPAKLQERYDTLSRGL